MGHPLPAIPAKRYFTIGEVSELCGVKPYVLRYWEQEFTQLKPMKRRGNRRYYQHHEVLLVRRIRDLLYDQGFTISGARNQLGDLVVRTGDGEAAEPLDDDAAALESGPAGTPTTTMTSMTTASEDQSPMPDVTELTPARMRAELLLIRELLGV